MEIITLGLGLGAAAIVVFWIGIYAGAKSKPEEKRHRSPYKTANYVTAFTFGIGISCILSYLSLQ